MGRRPRRHAPELGCVAFPRFAPTPFSSTPCSHADAPAVVLIQTFLFRNLSVAVYKFGYTGALASYVIVILKSLGMPRLDVQWAQRAFVDENVQYALLAFYWWISTPVNSESPRRGKDGEADETGMGQESGMGGGTRSVCWSAEAELGCECGSGRR
jgi:hypothetical protein